jgi:hypothetical protein
MSILAIKINFSEIEIQRCEMCLRLKLDVPSLTENASSDIGTHLFDIPTPTAMIAECQ